MAWFLGLPAAETAGSDGRADDHHDDHVEQTVELRSHDHGLPSGSWWTSRKSLLTIASGVAFVAAYGVAKAIPDISQWAFIVAMLIGLVPIARRAILAALAGTPFSIEMLMTIAAVGAVIIGAREEATAVVFLFLVGEMLEGVAAGRARASIQGLADLVPKTALVERDRQTATIEAKQVGNRRCHSGQARRPHPG